MFKQSARRLWMIRMLLHEQRKLRNRLVVVLLTVIRLAEPVPGIRQEAGVGIELNLTLETADR